MGYSELLFNLIEPVEELHPDEGIYHLKFKVQAVGKAAPVDSNLDLLKLTGLLENWDNRTDLTWENVMEVGDLLGKALLPAPLDEILLQYLPKPDADQDLRIRLVLAYPFTNYPWEYLLVNDTGGENTANQFLGLRKNVSIVRQQESHRPSAQLVTAKVPTKMVIALASPKLFQPVLDLSKERSAIEAAVARYPKRIQAVYSEPATAADLQEKLKDAQLFHFAGHTTMETEASELFGKLQGRGKLILDNGKGFNAEMSFEQLSHLLASANTRVAWLGGCETARRDDRFVWSSLAANLLNAGLFAVVGMQYKIGNDSATSFSSEFYNALLAGLPVDQAMTNGRMAVANANNVRDWAVPALYLADFTDGIVFKEFKDDANLEEVRRQINISVNQTAKVLEGNLVGIKAKKIFGGIFKVTQNVEEVGENANVVGIEAEELNAGKANVQMDIKKVKKGGNVTGVEIDDLG